METRVLVAFATKYGATAGSAEKIGQVLRRYTKDNQHESHRRL